MMELKVLKAFTEVVRLGGFTRAAEALCLTQPAVSKMVRALEDELGTPLLLREGRSIRLTDAGRVVHEQGLAVLAATERLHGELEAVGQLVRGQLRMGLPPMVGGAFFAPVVGAFRERHPGVELILTEDGARDLERGVANGEQELAVTVLPCAIENLATLEFSSEDLCLLAPAGSVWGTRESIAIGELRDEALILFNTGFALADRIAAACREAGFAPRVAARSGQWDFIAELVSARLGLALLPRRLCERLDPARFVWTPLLRPRIPWRLAIIWRREAYLSHAARAFLAQARESFGLDGDPPTAA
ncbi:LysR family transcriptional regulator [Uliginosibacterium paludis]|uniref:LysR family transcriptional regulator n=1 Tax=Uliginosibacterium paludis TaxID=1615952 RepID=A0ABV2CQH3_9RHOO